MRSRWRRFWESAGRQSARKPAPALHPPSSAASRCSSSSALSDASLDYQCPCCWKTLLRPVVTSCGHAFCEDCLRRWTVLMGKASCPCCRASLPDSVPPVDRQLERMIEQLCPQEPAGSSAHEGSLQHAACGAEEAECVGVQGPEPAWDHAHAGCFWLPRRSSSVRQQFP